MKPQLAVVIAGALAFSGCATSYQATGFTGGFSETKLGPDVVRVVFEGNGYTRKQRSQDFALLRSAELSLQAGFPYFVVLSEENETKAHTSTTSGRARTTGSSQVIGNRIVYTGNTTYDPGRTITSYKPETGLMVQFLKDKPEGVLAFDASFVVTSIKGKYKIK